MPDPLPNDTPTQRLADRILDGELESFVVSRRTSGKSWRVIARDLYNATDGEIDVTYETVRGWFAELAKAAAS